MENRAKHRLLVENLHKMKTTELDKHHYIKGGTIYTEDKAVKWVWFYNYMFCYKLIRALNV